MRRGVTVGRGAGASRPLGARRRAVRASLIASGAASPLQTNFMLDGTLAGRRFYQLALDGGFSELAGDSWPCEGGALGELPNLVFRDGDEAVIVLKDGQGVAKVSLGYGWFHVRVAAQTAALAEATCSTFRQTYPASYLAATDDPRVPITFWTLGRFGPISRLRRVESAAWEEIEHNYAADARTPLADLMAWSEPPDTGQLILWQGPPGTGKSWALRALASEWAPWAEFSYITDPEAFFVKDPSYMIDVLLADSYATLEAESDDVYLETNPAGKWRVLILEDTGELLAADAKESYGQGLSRLLNVVDGMIGQGLRVLALVTTNDELGDLHPAVARQGRCASQIAFGPLSAEEASTWLGEPVDESCVLADLFARHRSGEQAFAESEDAAAAADDVVPAAAQQDGGDDLAASAEEREYRELLTLARLPLPPLED